MRHDEPRPPLQSNRSGPGRLRALPDRDTRQLSAEHPLAVNAYQLLDHRTRARAVLAEVAAPGRYLAVEHDGRSWLISLQRPITHIGRGLIADVRLEDPHVSRRHAIVAVRGDGPDAVRVLDDRSSAGTFVNGRQVTVAQLHDGDIVRVGRMVLRYAEIAPEAKPRRALRRMPVRARLSGRTCRPPEPPTALRRTRPAVPTCRPVERGRRSRLSRLPRDQARIKPRGAGLYTAR